MPRPRAKQRRSAIRLSPTWPLWYEPHAALGSAIRYLGSLSPNLGWVGIYILKKKKLKLGPSLGAPNQKMSQLVIPIRNREGKILGQIDIDSQTMGAFKAEEENAIRKVAQELGDLWPDPDDLK